MFMHQEAEEAAYQDSKKLSSASVRLAALQADRLRVLKELAANQAEIDFVKELEKDGPT
jgi:hypothetical protein